MPHLGVCQESPFLKPDEPGFPPKPASKSNRFLTPARRRRAIANLYPYPNAEARTAQPKQREAASPISTRMRSRTVAFAHRTRTAAPAPNGTPLANVPEHRRVPNQANHVGFPRVQGRG